ncbi:MAG: hypothetical protein B7X39_03280 [Lysobacterales bacterium 14-68-21]|nr:MAG: hypothetical protein B7X45_04910 [Xanthomonadales bacterium 15-68-25]OZB68206.1 MAG: hypothetical protein B7X39_03280 [Xanthomonadales bacterium 14-68-21]
MLVLVGLCQVGIVHAAKDKPIVKAQTKDEFAAVAATVRKEMVPGGRFEFIDSKERATVDARLDEMTALFDSYGSVDQMNQDAKIKLFNDQEEINAILRHRDDNRRICESVAPVGSHIPRTICTTYRDQELERRRTQQFLDDTRLNHPQIKSGK